MNTTYLDTKSVLNAIAEALQVTANKIVDAHLAAGQKASGNAAQSFKVVIDEGDLSVSLIGAPYTGVLENGRRGGKVPFNMEEILLRWAENKGIYFKDERDAFRFAHAVKWKIKLLGTDLYIKGGRKDIYTDKIDEVMKQIPGILTPSFQKEINKIIR